MQETAIGRSPAERPVEADTRPAGQVPVLWHLKISHFNEKARWALDYKGVPHRRMHPMPGTHIAIAALKTRRVSRRMTTFPLLELDGETIHDSTAIVAALEERYPEPPLYPADPGERRRALDLEDFFDEQLGPYVRRFGWWYALSDQDNRRARTEQLIERQGVLMTLTLPAVNKVICRRYGIDEPAVNRSVHQIRSVLLMIERTLAGRDHLVGDRFTIADLTAAALLAPLLQPPEFPYLKQLGTQAPAVEELAREIRAMPAGRWAMEMYERYRPPSAEI
jgi:glutathione S-transferase